MVSENEIYRCKQPSPSVSISKRTLWIASIALALVVGISLVFKGQKVEKVATNNDMGAIPHANFMSSLPASYDKLPRDAKRPPTIVKLFEHQESTIISDIERERQKRALEAKRSPILFQNVSLPPQPRENIAKYSSDSSGSNNDPNSSESSPRDDANRQDDKRAFLLSTKGDGDVLNERLKTPISDYQLMAGTIIPGILLTGINSDLPGQILGQVSENIFDTVAGKYLLVPQGTRIIGEYDSRIVYGQERVLVVWTRLIFPNGNSLSLEGMPGVDLSGMPGSQIR